MAPQGAVCLAVVISSHMFVFAAGEILEACNSETCLTDAPHVSPGSQLLQIENRLKERNLATTMLNINEADNITPRDYEEAYNDLYKNHGYHANSDYTHETGAIDQMVAYRDRLPPTASALHKVLILGCSHGKGAELLHKHGFNAYGIDVAHRAIERANDRSRTCESGTEPCFVQGSLMKLPYSNSSFDGGLSVDVLEHIAPGDVPQVVKEISRVVRHHLFLQIASFTERSKNGEKAGMANVHLTVEGPQWWKTAFAQGGWKVTRDTSDASYVHLILEK